MNLLARLFWLPFNDRIVDSAVAPGLAKTLGSFVRARGLSHISLSDELLDELLAEAIDRAAAQESDGKPRYRVLWRQIEDVADAVARAYKGCDVSDAGVIAILEKHEPNRPDA